MTRSAAPPRQAPAAEPPRGLLSSWVRFWFAPADPVGLHRLRLLAGLLFLAWLLPFAGQRDALFGLDGWFDARAYAEAARLPDGPPQPLGWSVLFLCRSDTTLLAVAYGLSLAVLVLFTLGVATRLTAPLTWVVVVSYTANPAIAYDADALLVLPAFYLALGYLLLGQGARGLSLRQRLLGTGAARIRESVGANLALRLLQVHFALVMLVSGLHKLQFGDWWAGLALWPALHPPFETTLEGLRQEAPHASFTLTLLSAAAYAALAWQIAFPAFAWRPRWRPVLLGGGLLAWLGNAFLYRLPLLGPAIFLGCLSYVAPAGWRALDGLLARTPGLPGLRRRLSRRPEVVRLGGKGAAVAPAVSGGQHA
jgi:hypothetical protein